MFDADEDDSLATFFLATLLLVGSVLLVLTVVQVDAHFRFIALSALSFQVRKSVLLCQDAPPVPWLKQTP